MHSSVAADEWCNTQFGEVHIFSPLAYQCSKLGDHFHVYINIDNKSETNAATTINICYPDFPHQSIPQYYHHDISTLGSTEQAVLDRIQITNEEAVVLEQATQSQSQNRLWLDERKLRVTVVLDRRYGVGSDVTAEVNVPEVTSQPEVPAPEVTSYPTFP